MIPIKMTPLAQLATVSAGQAAPKADEFSESGVPFVRAGSLDSLISGKSESDLELVGNDTAKLRKLKTYPKGTILFAKSGMSATKDRIYVLQNPAYVVSHLATLIPNGIAHADYLRLALKYFPPSILIRDLAYPSINLGDIQSFEIPVPEKINDQIGIAYLLGKVERLIAQRKQQLHQLDELLKSVFLEMFGNPVSNERGWTKKPLSALIEGIDSGKSPKCEPRRATNDEWGVLKLGAVTSCFFKECENKALPRDVNPSFRDEVKIGDLLFSRKNTYELVAACAYVFKTRPKLLLPDLIFRFVFRNDSRVNPIYMWRLFNSEPQRKRIQSLAGGAAGSMPNISKANLKQELLSIPPLELQDKFAAIVERAEAIKGNFQRNLSDFETLYGALCQQAFKGELDLSRVPLPGLKPEKDAAVPREAIAPHAPELAINLPDTGNMLDAMHDSVARKALITQWLEAYRVQIGDTPFSVQRFIDAGLSRLAELHPDEDVDLSNDTYEQVKQWVFASLEAGALTQTFDNEDNRVQLRADQI